MKTEFIYKGKKEILMKNNHIKTILIILVLLVIFFLIFRSCQRTKSVQIKQHETPTKSEYSVEVKKNPEPAE